MKYKGTIYEENNPRIYEIISLFKHSPGSIIVRQRQSQIKTQQCSAARLRTDVCEHCWHPDAQDMRAHCPTALGQYIYRTHKPLRERSSF